MAGQSSAVIIGGTSGIGKELAKALANLFAGRLSERLGRRRVLIGGWLRALFVASGGRRGGLIALLAFSGFATLIALYDMQYVFSGPMPWPELTMIFVMLGLAVLAMAVLASSLGRSKAAG